MLDSGWLVVFGSGPRRSRELLRPEDTRRHQYAHGGRGCSVEDPENPGSFVALETLKTSAEPILSAPRHITTEEGLRKGFPP